MRLFYLRFSIYQENNKKDSTIWGLSENEVIENIKKINARKILYIDDGRDDCNWLKSSEIFKPISTLNTNDYPNSFKGILWPNENPKFHLYSYNDKPSMVL